MKEISLRAYQTAAKENILTEFEITGRANLVLACGLGKTVIAISVVEALLQQWTACNTLFVCHSCDILAKAKSEFEAFCEAAPSPTFGMFTGTEKTLQKTTVLFASFQSLENHLAEFNHDAFDFVIVDEAHHAHAPTYKRVIDYFKPAYSLGMTATPEREDGLTTHLIWGEPVYSLCFAQAVGQGLLPTLKYHLKLLDVNLEKLAELVAEANALLPHECLKMAREQLNKTLFVTSLNDAWVKDLHTEIGDRKAIVFCNTIEHCERMAQQFKKGAAFHGGNEAYPRSPDNIFTDFIAGMVNPLFAVNRVNEGMHPKGTEVLVFLRWTGSKLLLEQQIGRGLTGGQESLTVFDYVGNLERLLEIRALEDEIKAALGGSPNNKEPQQRKVTDLKGEGCISFTGESRLIEDILQILDRSDSVYVSEVPALMAEFHKTKNTLSPYSLKTGSCQKVWWQCAHGHEWEAIVRNKKNGHGCPVCAGRKVNASNNLATQRPDLAVEWHPTKNGALTPQDVVPGSNKKVWWQCAHDHEWEAIVQDRKNGSGCPYCSGYKADASNNLAVLLPDLARQWHPTQNGALTPQEVVPGSGKKVWWQCAEGHAWEATVVSRKQGHGCPYCAGHKTDASNNLAIVLPDLARQWHPTLNGALTPQEVTPGSNRKVWWQCAEGHAWEATVVSRKQGNGCPICNNERKRRKRKP